MLERLTRSSDIPYMPEHKPPPDPDGHELELARWLEEHGLGQPEVLAVIPNEVLERLGPDELRLLHGLLEAAYQLRRSDPTDD
jgi:hypothetical protein